MSLRTYLLNRGDRGNDRYKLFTTSGPPCKENLVQWTVASKTAVVDGATQLIDQLGTSGSESGRNGVGGWYFDGDGVAKIRTTDYIATALTYVDHTTGITESGTTDVNGDFLIPTNGADSITIDGYTANAEETNTSTAVEFVNRELNDTFYGYIQNATGADRVQSDAIASVMDEVGYTESDGATYFYDQTLTLLVPQGERSTTTANGKCGWWIDNGVLPIMIPATTDGYVPVTTDGFVPTMEE